MRARSLSGAGRDTISPATSIPVGWRTDSICSRIRRRAFPHRRRHHRSRPNSLIPVDRRSRAVQNVSVTVVDGPPPAPRRGASAPGLAAFPAVLDNPIRTVNLGDHGLHVANAREHRPGTVRPHPDPLRGCARDGSPGEVIDPAGTGRRVGDEVEDALPQGVDGGGDRDGPTGGRF